MTKVITYGTFDLFHEGHYRLLQRAKALGDYLIVGVTTEEYDKTRGKLNVVDSLVTRIENVRKSGFADEIIIEESPGQKFTDIKKYNIDIFTVGSDWVGCFDYLKDYCKVVYLERTKDISSTMLRQENSHIQRIGIIGTGRIASRFVVEAKLVSGVSTQGVYNPHEESMRAFADRWQINGYKDLASFYEDVDVVYIATPHETHYAYIKDALNHGKHVICEKPMVLKRQQAEELFALAKEKGLILFEGVKTAYCPGFHKLLDRELFAPACLHVVNTTLNIIELPLKLFPLSFNAHRDFFKLAMPNNDRIIIARSDTGAELLAVARFKILLPCHKDIGTRIEPQVLGSPLTDQMIWHNEHCFIT